MISRQATIRAGARVALLLISAAACLIAVELLIRTADWFAEARAITRAGSVSEETPTNRNVAKYIQHPFLGYAGNPAYPTGLLSERELTRIFEDEPSGYYLRNRGINAQGFESEHDDYRDPSTTFDIGIFGGSVAAHVGTIAGEVLIAEVERRFPEWVGQVRVLNLATPGYKQPQQTISLLLMLLQGVHLDVVVNLDGFNEVALSAAGFPARYDPLLPSRSHYELMLQLTSQGLSSRLVEKYAEASRLRQRATELIAGARHSWLGQFEWVRAVVGQVAGRRLDQASRIEYALQNEDRALEGIFALESPCYEKGQPGCWELIVDIWQRSSLSMRAISEQTGAQYLHFVQPNQYVEGSKPMGAREAKIARDERLHWSRGVATGYPLLAERFERMRAEGVDLRDLTLLFADTEDVIFIDNCCHLNQRGLEMVAREIASAIDPDHPRRRPRGRVTDAPLPAH